MLLANARLLIAKSLARAKNPAMLCSFGKDSMVLLHLVRELKPDIPVIYFRGFPHPTKHDFAEQQIESLRLHMIEPQPFFRDVIGDETGRVQVIEIFGPGIHLHFPLEAHDGFQPDKQSFCALEKLQEPVSEALWDFDTLFIGHRGDDVDPFWGEIPLQADVTQISDCRLVYPLREWTEQEIWSASWNLGIRQNVARYKGELDQNNDYYPLCTNCLKATGDDSAWCPKIGSQIPNISEAAGVLKQKEVWRQAFTNLKETFYEPTS